MTETRARQYSFFSSSFLRTYFYNTTVKNPKRYQNRILLFSFFIINIIIIATLGEKNLTRSVHHQGVPNCLFLC